MPKQRAWQQGDICYITGHRIRSLIHLVRPHKGRKGHSLTSIKINIKEESVLIILKKNTPQGPRIAFLEAGTMDEALWVMALGITSKTIKWREDEWEIRNIDKNRKKR